MVASKLSQILQLSPAQELLFQGPFDKVVTTWLELKNPSEKRVCFKVKTTAPRRYCVRPNSGIMEPGGKIKIAIMLQPMEPECFGERNKHKFMVQSTIVPREGETGDFDEIWASATQEQIMDSKLKCTFTEERKEENSSPELEPEPAAADSPVPDLIGGAMKLTSTPAASTSAPTGGQSSPQQLQQQYQQQAQQQQNQSSFSVKGIQRTPQQQRQHHQQQQQPSQLMSSFHDSFYQSMSDDRKVVLISLLMLILGVVLGKYII